MPRSHLGHHAVSRLGAHLGLALKEKGFHPPTMCLYWHDRFWAGTAFSSLGLKRVTKANVAWGLLQRSPLAALSSANALVG